MTAASCLLGLRLDDALAKAQALGLPTPTSPTITKGLKEHRSEGTLRVLRVCGDEWVVGLFADGEPTE